MSGKTTIMSVEQVGAYTRLAMELKPNLPATLTVSVPLDVYVELLKLAPVGAELDEIKVSLTFQVIPDPSLTGMGGLLVVEQEDTAPVEQPVEEAPVEEVAE